MEEKDCPMKIILISDDFNCNLFNQKALHPLQSWEWGEARKKMGIEVFRMGEFEGNALVNVYQPTFHTVPYTHWKIGYLPRSVFPSDATLQFLTQYSKKNHVIFVKIEPYERKLKIKTNKYLHLSPHPLFPTWNQILDLTQSEDELLKNMHPKTRYNINLAQKKGITIKEMTNKEGFEIFVRLYFETCKRQKYLGHNKTYHQMIFETLHTSIAHILIAFYKNIPLAAYEVFIFNDVLYYPYGGSSEVYRNLMPSNLLMWEAIKFSKQRGAKRFDMWGSLPHQYNSKNPWSGFTRFKEGYGGQFVEYVGSYDLVNNNFLYQLYNKLYILRNKLLVFSRIL